GWPAAAGARLPHSADERPGRAHPQRDSPRVAPHEPGDDSTVLGLVPTAARAGRYDSERRTDRQPRHAAIDAGVPGGLSVGAAFDRQDGPTARWDHRRGSSFRAADADAPDMGSARPHLSGESRRDREG